MTKGKSMMKMFSSCMVATSMLIGVSGTSFAECDQLEALMGEGIPYECAAGIKAKATNSDNNANIEASMAEGISYADSVVADNETIINYDYKLALAQGLDDCNCEGPAYGPNNS